MRYKPDIVQYIAQYNQILYDKYIKYYKNPQSQGSTRERANLMGSLYSDPETFLLFPHIQLNI